MTEEITVNGMGQHIIDRHTHYELHVHVGPYPGTIIIPGYVADAFREAHGREITKSGMLAFKASFRQESELIAECRDPYKPGTHRRAVITEIDQIYIE